MKKLNASFLYTIIGLRGVWMHTSIKTFRNKNYPAQSYGGIEIETSS
jgi:hypothetical protein